MIRLFSVATFGMFLLISSLFYSCSGTEKNKKIKGAVKRKYFSVISKDIAIKEVFPLSRIDTASNESGEFTFPVPFRHFDNIDSLKKVYPLGKIPEDIITNSKLRGIAVDGWRESYFTTDSLVFLSYGGQIHYPVRGYCCENFIVGYGAAVFRKNNNGWYLSNNKFNLFPIRNGKYDYPDFFGEGALKNGSPTVAVLFGNEHYTVDRKIFAFDANLRQFMPDNSYTFSGLIITGGESDVRTPMAGITYDGNIFGEKNKITGYNPYAIYSSEGYIKKIKWVPQFLIDTVYNKGINTKACIEGEVRRTFSSYYYEYAPDNLWKDFINNKCYFFSVERKKFLAKGNLSDSTIVKSKGYVVANSIYKQSSPTNGGHIANSDFDPLLEMSTQLNKARAIQDLNNKIGICNYCNGNGCLQCGNTGRVQKMIVDGISR